MKPTKINLIRIIPLTLFILLVILVFNALERENSDVIPSVYIGKPPPPLILNKLGNLPLITLGDLKPTNGEQVTIINFWASWCPPCRVEHPQLEQISKINDVKIIGVNYKDKEIAALDFLVKYGNPFSKLAGLPVKIIYVDKPLGRNAIEWGVYGVPETFILNKKGHIIYRHPGPITKKIYKNTIEKIIN